MANHPTKIKPGDTDAVLLSEEAVLSKVVSDHTISIKSSLCRRGMLKNVDNKGRTHYLKQSFLNHKLIKSLH